MVTAPSKTVRSHERQVSEVAVFIIHSWYRQEVDADSNGQHRDSIAIANGDHIVAWEEDRRRYDWK